MNKFLINSKKKLKVSAIVPAYNEEKTIAGVLKTVVLARQNGLIDEVIVVSDGSTDNTSSIARSSGADKVLELEKNIGKTKAVIKGFQKSEGDIILLLDADLLGLLPEHIESLLTPLFRKEADMIIGYLVEDTMQNILPHLSGQRALKREIISQINTKSIELDKYGLEILLNRIANKNSFKTLFVPLQNVSHIRKSQKYGLMKGFFRKALFSLNLLYLYRWQILGIIFLAAIFIFWNIFFRGENVQGIVLNKLNEPQRGDSILIVVSHPDDEILGAGGYIYRALQNGSLVKIVFITNGDGNKLSAAVSEKGFSSDDFIGVGKIRMNESLKAASILGLAPENLIFLGFPDRNIKYLFEENWEIPRVSSYTKLNRNEYDGTYKKYVEYTGENLLLLLSEIIKDFNPSIIITHNPEDKHLDHSATYYFLKQALIEAKLNPTIYTFLIHWNKMYYPKPFGFHPSEELYPPSSLQSKCAWYIFPISEEDEKVKYEAIKQFRSQLESPYLYILLKTFLRKNELFCLDNG